MIQRITELWPNLLRRGRAEQSDAEEPLLGRSDDSEDSGMALRVDEAQLLQDYRNLWWTRLITVEGFEPSPDTEGDN